MTLQDLITLYREQAKDKQQPFFVSDAVLTVYANEAQDEACRRGQLLRQSIGPMCLLSFAAGDELVSLDPSVVRVLRAFVNGRMVNVVPVGYMDLSHPNWQADAVRGQPQVLVSGLSTDALQLWPTPDTAGEVRLTVQRLPVTPMAALTDTPEIRREAHAALVDWMLYRAYSSEDTEIYNDSKAQLALKRFTGEFGAKASTRNETWVRDGAGVLPAPLA